jgi:hypothetical protein
LNRRDFISAVLLLAVVVLLYRKITRLWWTYDDAYILHLVIANKLRSFFTDGTVWPQKLFTPLEPLAFRVQLAWFGLDPARWFALHLALIAASVIAIFAAARAWFDEVGAFIAALLYASSIALCSLTSEISGTHYFQAITLAAISCALWVRAVSRKQIALSLLSALVYLAAALAKETVVPLPLLLLVLPRRDWRNRAFFAAPHFVALAIYLVWRRAVLGTILGGYGWAIRSSDWPSLIATLPQKTFLAMAGNGVLIGSIAVVVLVAGAMLSLRDRRAFFLFLVAFALAAGPVLPVSKEMQRRYGLMPWLVLSFAFVAGAGTLPRRRRIALLTIGAVLVVAANRQEWRYEFARQKRMSDEGRTFWDMPPNGMLRLPFIPPAAMGELNWLKTEYAKRPAGAGWFYDDFFLCRNDLRGKRTWTFDPQSRRVVEMSDLDALASRFCSALRNDVPLSAKFDFEEGALFWDFGPYADGQWRVLIADGVQAFDVPRRDGFRLGNLPGMTLRVRYESPQGWVTVSPDIALDFVHHPERQWVR